MHMRCLPVIWLAHYVWSMKHISESGWLNFNGIFASNYWSGWCHTMWCLLIRIKSGWWYCWWFRNPANQLRLVVEIPWFTVTGFQNIPGGFSPDFWTINSILTCLHHLECIKPCRYIMGKNTCQQYVMFEFLPCCKRLKCCFDASFPVMKNPW